MMLLCSSDDPIRSTRLFRRGQAMRPCNSLSSPLLALQMRQTPHRTRVHVLPVLAFRLQFQLLVHIVLDLCHGEIPFGLARIARAPFLPRRRGSEEPFDVTPPCRHRCRSRDKGWGLATGRRVLSRLMLLLLLLLVARTRGEHAKPSTGEERMMRTQETRRFARQGGRADMSFEPRELVPPRTRWTGEWSLV